jgi:flavin-dependent dehydrogenase
VIDVLVVGAGPAGSVAATVLARAGARVKLVDRARFPREKLCGDTINPGTLAILRRLQLHRAAETRGLPIAGMVVTGESGVSIEGRYPRGLHGVAITRAELDWALVQEAIGAGVDFEDRVAVRAARLDEQRGVPRVTGVNVISQGHERDVAIEAPVTIAADGRHSSLTFGLGLARHPDRPRRWAIGAYFEGVREHATGVRFGEMHIRRGRYVGISPVGDGRTNVCVVKPSKPGDADFRDPMATLRAALESEPLIAERFRDARPIGAPTLLGPLAVEATAVRFDGLVAAGDAAGFVDPMTGDGLRFAIRGGELAAEAALLALDRGWPGVHDGLTRARTHEFASKWRFNRVLRALVSSPAAVHAAARASRLAPSLVHALVARAGDCDRAA